MKQRLWKFLKDLLKGEFMSQEVVPPKNSNLGHLGFLNEKSVIVFDPFWTVLAFFGPVLFFCFGAINDY